MTSQRDGWLSPFRRTDYGGAPHLRYGIAVYGWMCAGLATTATSAWFIASSPTIVRAIAANRARGVLCHGPNVASLT